MMVTMQRIAMGNTEQLQEWGHEAYIFFFFAIVKYASLKLILAFSGMSPLASLFCLKRE